jgi:hypothetical protein
MKKSVVATLGLILVFGLTSMAGAAAATDVPANHWAYDAVKKLAVDGIVDGYGNGRFSGDKTLTCFEFAVVVARAMGKEDKATAEQKALIDKLAAEYKVELDKLGVRVHVLEERTSGIQISGSTRLRFDQQSAGTTYDDKHINMNLNFTYKINNGWIAKIESDWQRPFDNPSLGETAGRNALAANEGINSQMEQLYVTGPLVGTTVKFGQFNYNPVYGLAFDTRVVGGEATFGNVVKATLTSANTASKNGFLGVDVAWAVNKNTNGKASYQRMDVSGVKTKYNSVGLDSKVAEDFLITAAVAKSDNDSNNKTYFSQLQYKVADTAVVGSNDIFVSYRKVPKNAVYYTTKDLEDRILNLDFKGVQIGFDYVPRKNTKFTAWYMAGKDVETNEVDKKIYRGQMEFYF